MTPELKQRINKEALYKYEGNHPIMLDARAGYIEGATVWAERAEKLMEALYRISNEFEHEDYGSNSAFCPVCIADRAIEQYKKETV